MSQTFATPQDVEDAYYDAIDERDLEAMMAVWEDSEQTACLLPMMPLQRGPAAIREAWRPLLAGQVTLDMEIRHLGWIELGEIAIHLVEERVQAPGQAGRQAVYASNLYRKGSAGWRLLMHQNSPTPPAPGLKMPDLG